MSDNEIDHDCTDNVVCPFCGHDHDGDAVFEDVRSNDTALECDKCGKSFDVMRDFSVYYYTSKPRDTTRGKT